MAVRPLTILSSSHRYSLCEEFSEYLSKFLGYFNVACKTLWKSNSNAANARCSIAPMSTNEITFRMRQVIHIGLIDNQM